MFSRLGCALLLLLLWASPSEAQLGLSYTTFSPQSTISSVQFTANFTNINDKALNRYAAVLRGTLAVDADATYDLGASGTRFRDGFFSRNLTVAGTATVSSATITTLSVTSFTCAGCLGTSQIATDGVGADEIAANAVGAAEIAADAVGPSEIATDAVGAAEIAAGAVGTSEIAAGAVTSALIADGTITSSDLGVDSVGAEAVAANAIGAAEIAADAVGASEIASGAVGADELASTSVAAGSYGSASAVATFAVDADGRLTTASTTSISIAETQIQDGSLYARLAANETVAGTWTFATINAAAIAHTTTFNIQATAGGEYARVDFAPSYLGSGTPAAVFTLLDGGASYTPLVIYPQLLTTRMVAPIADGVYTLGYDDGASSRARFANIHLSLPQNASPSYVVVNKGSSGGDASALGYIAAGDRTVVIGGCTLTVKAGLITNAVGC